MTASSASSTVRRMGKLKSIKRGMDYAKSSSAEQVCSCCGEPVSRETLDVEQYRPGAFARLTASDQMRCSDGSDVVVIPRGVGEFATDTWYIRCILYLPIQEPIRFGSASGCGRASLQRTACVTARNSAPTKGS